MEESKKLELREKILERSVEVGSRIIDLEELTTVSYTHLTLPTIYSV